MDAVVGVGPLAAGDRRGRARGGAARRVAPPLRDAAAAAAALADLVRPGDAVLVKGSRAVRLETVVDALAARFGEGEA